MRVARVQATSRRLQATVVDRFTPNEAAVAIWLLADLVELGAIREARLKKSRDLLAEATRVLAVARPRGFRRQAGESTEVKS
jgi:hypothetical protein